MHGSTKRSLLRVGASMRSTWQLAVAISGSLRLACKRNTFHSNISDLLQAWVQAAGNGADALLLVFCTCPHVQVQATPGWRRGSVRVVLCSACNSVRFFA
ncbi:hypothetical protein KC19_6G060400 [Ceratodon purpureus]|uniref:GATA-type domain-containing protein n=1 Tax=Ceratodon purpureus TaxID=3225 RepID=A0A8T0HDM2_CERPU|nr:hypothetical protein KC19_6G060200 [Ceratodon purpureus]KAG0569027.1 hypothetical protein KC19_6G060400 [Ceratodon purpureus]